MEKPSLEIGNSNWAIKEGELLGYNRVGNDYLPIPITMTRASLGTRVNPESLVEDVELLGSEEVTNGDFATDSDWTIEDVWTISGGSANGNGANGSSQQLVQSSVFEIGKTYKVTYDIINYVSGSVFMPNVGSSNSGNGTYIEYITATQQDFKITGTNFYGSVTNVSAKKATIDNLARVDYTDGTSSLLAEPQRTNLIQYSEAITQANGYSPSGVTLASNQGTTPMGTNNATKLTSTGTDPFIQYVVPNTNATFTLSVYAKGVGSSVGKNINFFLVRDNYAEVAQSSQFTLTNEWVRYTATLSLSTNPTTQVIYRLDAPSVGVAGDEVLIWGAQLEQGSYATSYIPTSGGIVTRVQDQYEKTGISNLINSTEGVLFVEMAAFSESNLNSYITIGQNTSNGILGISFYTGSNNILLDHWEGASETYHIESISDVTEFNKIAICYDGTSIKGYINGSPVWNTTVTAWSSNALSELNFAFGNSGTNKFLGKVKQLQIYKTALSDDELIILTGTSGVHFYTSYAAMASGLTYKIE